VGDTDSVPIDDHAMQEALARYNNQSRETRRRADVTSTIVLLVVHGILACGTALALFVWVDTAACALFHCEDQPFFSQAFGIAVPAAGLVFAADLAVALRRITRQKLAFVVPLIGCAVQIALAFATYTTISEGGLGL
jgi:hypothetical protein